MVSVPGKDTGIDVTAETVGYSEDGNALCFSDQRQEHIQTMGKRGRAGHCVLDVLCFSGFSSAYARNLSSYASCYFSPLFRLYLNIIWMCLHNYPKQMSFKTLLLTFSSTIAHSPLKEPLATCEAPACIHTSTEAKTWEPICWANRAFRWRERSEQQWLRQRQRNTLPNQCLTELLQYRLIVWLGCAALCWLQTGLGMETWEGLCTSEGVCHQIALANVDCEAGLRLDQV